MAKNKLILNSDKTHLMIKTSSRKHNTNGDFGICLNTGTETILPQCEERLLGANLSNNLCWNTHIRESKSSLISNLTSRINALCKVSYYANFKTRKMVANGIVMSFLSYLIPLYGGCAEYLLTALQTLQNRAARHVTKSSWNTSASAMLSQIGWLNVRQMVAFHSLMLIFKAKQDHKPVYLHSQVSATFIVNTRLAVNNGMKENRRIKSSLGQQSFIPRSISQWNSVPWDIRGISNIAKFKRRVKEWMKKNF